MLLTNAAYGRAQATDHVALTELSYTISNASCDVRDGSANSLRDSTNG